MVMGITNRIPSVGDLLKYADKALLNNFFYGDWDIVDTKTKKRIAKFDSFLGYDYTNDVSVMNHPIEKGSFANYNKVVDPDNVNIILAKSGFPFEIREMIEVLEKYKNECDNIDVATPYKTYENYNINRLHYAVREGSAINLLVVEISLVEIKEVEIGYKTTGYSASNVANGEYADTKDTGKKKAVEESANNSKKQSMAFKIGKAIDNKLRGK